MLKHKLTLSLPFVLLSIALSTSVNALELNNVIIKSSARIDKKAMDKKLNPYLGKEIDIALLQNILNLILSI